MRVLLLLLAVAFLALSCLVWAQPLLRGNQPDDKERVELEHLHMHRWAPDGRATLPSGWVDIGALTGDEPLVLTLALRLRNTDALHKTLFAVSQPSSPDYGRYLSAQEANALVAPAPESLAAVLSWAQSVPGAEVLTGEESSLDSGMIRVRMPARSAEELLDTRFHMFRHLISGIEMARAHNFRYTVPAGLAQHLEFVGGVVRLPEMPRHLVDPEFAAQLQQMASEEIKTTPSFLWQKYNVSNSVPAEPANLQSIVSFLEQYIREADLYHFLERYYLPYQKLERIIGPNDQSKPGVEAALDIQYIMGVASRVRTWAWSTGGRNEYNQEPFLVWLHNVTASSEIPQLFSISYGDFEDTLGPEYMKRVDVEFQKLGTRGVSIFIASGDTGVSNITTPDGGCARFRSQFPTSSPHVVSVGATFFRTESNEEGVQFSSGGFSEVFSRSPWQEKAVSAFLAKNPVPPTLFNAVGRAFPDISAVGTNFQVEVSGRIENVGGTSASTPTVAALFSLINSQRLTAKKPALGFVLPFLYSAWEQDVGAYQDITSGNNKYGPCQGFDAISGWDAVTGVGVPNWAQLSKLALSSDMFPSFKEQ